MPLEYEQRWHRLKRALEIAYESPGNDRDIVLYDKSTVLQVLFMMHALEGDDQVRVPKH